MIMRVILNDGTILEDAAAGYSAGNLWITLHGMTLQEAAGIFFDTTKTAVIVYNYGDMFDRFEGFTVCVSLSVDVDNVVSVCLTRGET